MPMLVSMTLTLGQGYSGSAEENIHRWIISTTKQVISIKLASTVGHFWHDLDFETFIRLAQLVTPSWSFCFTPSFLWSLCTRTKWVVDVYCRYCYLLGQISNRLVKLCVIKWIVIIKKKKKSAYRLVAPAFVANDDANHHHHHHHHRHRHHHHGFGLF